MSMSEMTTYRWTFEEDVLAYRNLGIEAIGVWRTKLEEYGEERGAEFLKEQGLTVSSLSFAGGFTGADGHSYQEAIDDALDAVRIAGEIGAESLVIVAGNRGGHTTNHACRLLRDALLELGDAAAEVDVQLVVQPLNRGLAGRWSFLHNTETCLKVLQTCDHAHVGMALDLYHLGREANLVSRIPELAPWVKLVLVSDSPNTPRDDHDRQLPGAGVLPLAVLVQALDLSGYSGWYEMQLLSNAVWSARYDSLLQDCQIAFRNLWPSRTSGEPIAVAAVEETSAVVASDSKLPCPTAS
jgi:sugar phosphate isomerase/epimerase